MTTLVLEHDPIAVMVTADEATITVLLTDGRTIAVPTEWYPRLAHATPAERANSELLGHGSAIGWPDLDEHLSVASLLAGRASGESNHSLQRWLEARHGQIPA